jgi:hypothetical protein
VLLEWQSAEADGVQVSRHGCSRVQSFGALGADGADQVGLFCRVDAFDPKKDDRWIAIAGYGEVCVEVVIEGNAGPIVKIERG